jgi:hypothetical protein
MMEAPLLPSPLAISRRFVARSWLGAILALASGLAATIGYSALLIGDARAILRDQQVWSHGLVAEDVRVSGRETSRDFVLNSYELTATFTTRDGQSRSEKVSFDTFLQSVDRNAPLEARYDASDPSRVAISWAVNVTRGRWLAVLFLGVVGLFIGGALLVLGLRALERLFLTRRVTAGFEELEVTVSRVVGIRAHGRPTGMIKYEFLIPDGDPGKRPRKGSISFNEKKGHTPVFLSEDGRRILAVRPTGSRAVPVVLRQDGYPFALSEAARETLAAAAARRRDRNARSEPS